MKKILVLIVPLVAFVAGAFAGAMLKPASHDTPPQPAHGTGHDEMPAAEAHGETDHGAASHDGASHDVASHDGGHGEHDGHGKSGKGGPAWFSFSSQFFVPLVREGDSGGIMILTLSLETTAAELEEISGQEHRLRDILLRRLLIVANTGGFDGNFTTEGRIRGLRKQLLEAAQASVGPKVSGVLIEDIARQSN
ncbi:hypothetical protein A7A09_006010 [Paracoccus methylarcula]|uniref:Flagellar protein FliL n=1 Tax=Paracoccus methylarcula TaxID=72022 RepID=A0A422QZM1_9RHOB|nr:hypothetical protein A7A09_006010 [Paracoccus methylarcula]